MKTLDPMVDFVFKALFGKEDKTSKTLLIALLNDILVSKGEDKVESITYLNPFNDKEFETDKLSVLDIKARTEKDEMINIEIQVRAEDSYRKRSLYYWSKAYGESIQESESYGSLKKTIVINIMGYNAINETRRHHTVFKILEEEDYFVLLEDLQIHYLELPKLPNKEIEELEGVELWLDFLKETGKQGNEARIKGLRERSETMNVAINKLEEISSDERMRELYRAREKSRLDRISSLKYAESQAREAGMKQGIEQGIEQGVEQGMILGAQEEKIKLAKYMIENGEPIEKIIQYTKLDNKELEIIKLQLNN